MLGCRFSATGAGQPLIVDIDVEEARAHSYKRKAFLARYGRQSVLQWDNVPVNEIELHYRALGELLQRENTLAKEFEDS